MIDFAHVYKSYSNNVHALRDVSIKINKGEFVFLTGHSGAGKTTLFNVLAGYDKITSGSIEVSGFSVNNISQTELPYFRRKVGVVFQDFKLLNHRTVFENLSLPLEITEEKITTIKRKVEKMQSSLGLDKKANCFPDQLSGGEKQRVAIGRALIGQPELIIADEPTGNLDPELSRDVIEVFQQFNASGTTIFIATHDLDLVTSLKKRVINLNHGEINYAKAL